MIFFACLLACLHILIERRDKIKYGDWEWKRIILYALINITLHNAFEQASIQRIVDPRRRHRCWPRL